MLNSQPKPQKNENSNEIDVNQRKYLSLDTWIKNQWDIGSKVEVYSASYNCWFVANIIRIFNDSEGEWIEVQYAVHNMSRLKQIPRYNNDEIRPLSKAMIIYQYIYKAIKPNQNNNNNNNNEYQSFDEFEQLKTATPNISAANIFNVPSVNRDEMDQTMGDTVNNVQMVANTQHNILKDLQQLNVALDKIENKMNDNNINKKHDPKISLSLNTELGRLLLSLPKQGVIEYEKENNFWLVKLGKEWQQNRIKFAQLTEKLYCNEIWYKKGFELGKKWAYLFGLDENNENINIGVMPPTAVSGAHITLERIDIHDKNCPQCFIENNTVEFEIKRLVCFPSFWQQPKNLPGQQMNDNGLRYYATHWISVEIEFTNFDYKTRFPAHISLCNIAVQLNIESVEQLNDGTFEMVANTQKDVLNELQQLKVTMDRLENRMNNNQGNQSKHEYDEIMGDTVTNVEMVAEKQNNILGELKQLNVVLDTFESKYRPNNVINVEVDANRVISV